VVTRRRPGLGRAGKTKFGCLVALLVLAAVVYYGVDVGAIYFRYFELLDEMNQAAQLGRTLDDATIEARLHARIDSVGVPLQAQQFTIRRYERPPEIRITSSYNETVTLPFTHYTLHLHPVARAPL
jgi:hypothetical protein